ncbi:uncharacterized protein LOC131676393 [Topomyia yanbarensis]|uniref:uncharacterized protein LOC131676393 n=1 Tax=Topomyia yanbarensis TaxID=2498891 RepID=UPI00273CA1CA|nr:uncharacterized protein LOC131676393 [Topomyia yanbarensis]
MLRPIFGFLGKIFQIIRNNLKPLILLVSFGTFIWLIVNTTNRPEFTRHAAKSLEVVEFIEPKNRWNENSVQIFLSMLDIEANVTDLVNRSDQCSLKDETVFTAFIADTVDEALWQYYTLIALGQTLVLPWSNTFRVKQFLPRSTKEKLEQLFYEVPMGIMDELPFNCYDIANALIVTSTIDVPKPEKRNQIYILDSGVRRYMDLAAIHRNIKMRPLRLAHAEPANQRLIKLRNQSSTYLQVKNYTRVDFVGIYIRQNDMLPFEYYYRAIALQRKLHLARLIFVVICDDPLGNPCRKINAPSEEVYVQPAKETAESGQDFALMSLCNHTIVSNEVGIFHALNNGGNTVVYQFSEPTDRVRYMPWLIASELDRWYMLA